MRMIDRVTGLVECQQLEILRASRSGRNRPCIRVCNISFSMRAFQQVCRSLVVWRGSFRQSCHPKKPIHQHRVRNRRTPPGRCVKASGSSCIHSMDSRQSCIFSVSSETSSSWGQQEGAEVCCMRDFRNNPVASGRVSEPLDALQMGVFDWIHFLTLKAVHGIRAEGGNSSACEAWGSLTQDRVPHLGRPLVIRTDHVNKDIWRLSKTLRVRAWCG